MSRNCPLSLQEDKSKTFNLHNTQAKIRNVRRNMFHTFLSPC